MKESSLPRSRTALRACLTLAALVFLTHAEGRAQFTAGFVVVERVGDGSGLSSSASPLFLDVYDPTTASQASPATTLALPTTAAGSQMAVTDAGGTSVGGLLTRTADGLRLIVPGYNAPVGTANVTTTAPGTVNRSIAVVTMATSAIDSRNGFSDGPSSAFRSSASVSGSNFYSATNGSSSGPGVQYKTASSSVTATTAIVSGSLNATHVFAGSLFVSSSSTTNGSGNPSAGVNLVGPPGLIPTAGATTTLLSGTGTSGTGTPSPAAFYLFNNPLNANNFFSTTLDTLYVADSRSATNGGGVQRWVFNGTAWTLSGTVSFGGTVGARGLSALINGSTVTLFATTYDTATTNPAQSTLVTFTDTLTAGGGSFGAVTTLATAPAGTDFRGVEVVPEPATVLLVCAGAGFVGFARRRRRAAVCAEPANHFPR
jgi:hypothetical protein